MNPILVTATKQKAEAASKSSVRFKTFRLCPQYIDGPNEWLDSMISKIEILNTMQTSNNNYLYLTIMYRLIN